MRDRASEILDIKRRSPSGHEPVSFRLEFLRGKWLKTRESDGAVPDFYLIHTVTLLEVSARRQMTSLVDHAKQYTDRAVELSKHFKMDFATVRDVQGRATTLGDVVGHSVPVNSFGQIIGHFDTLLGKPFRPLLERAVDRWAVEIKGQPAEPIIHDYNVLASRLSRLFEIRHILCHEIPTSPVYAANEITDFLDEAIRFTRAVEEVLTFEKYGLVPLTQAEMNTSARDRLASQEEVLSRLLSVIRNAVQGVKVGSETFKSTHQSWLHSLDDAQEKWLMYRNAHCDFVTYLNQGGTVRPLFWSSEANRLTENRISELQSWVDKQSKGLANFSSKGANSE